MRLTPFGLTMLTLAGLILPQGAVAQQAAVPPGRWVIDYAQSRCSLARRVGGATSPIFLLGTILGGEGPQIVLLADGGDALPRDVPPRVDLVLAPTNVRLNLPVVRRRLRVGDSIVLEGLEESFIEQFGQATAVRIESGERPLLTISVPNSSGGIAALKACNDDLLRTWGIDPAAQLSLRSLPTRRPDSRPFIFDSDYPADAIRAGQQGTTVMRVAVGPDGRATDCVPVESAGSPSLDLQACRLTLERSRWSPAIDAEGRPTAASVVQRVRWNLPD